MKYAEYVNKCKYLTPLEKEQAIKDSKKYAIKNTYIKVKKLGRPNN